MRYSLVSLLLFATVIGLSIAYWKQSRVIQDMEKELRVLRDEEIQQIPPGRVVVRRLASSAPNTWRYRVHIPGGNDWVFCHSGLGSSGQMRHPTGTFSVFINLTEKPSWQGPNTWFLNYGTNIHPRNVDKAIKPEVAQRLREHFRWKASPRESNMPVPPFIGFLKTEDFAIWIAAEL